MNFWKKLRKPIIGMAPMDGITDASFRHMVCKYSRPSVYFTEFVNVEGLARGATEMLKSFIYEEKERPIVAQIFGVEAQSFYKASVMLSAMGFDGIDINMGCPASKVAIKGAGAGLIQNPELAKKLIGEVKRGICDWSEGINLEAAGVHPDIISEIGKMMKDGRLPDSADDMGRRGGTTGEICKLGGTAGEIYRLGGTTGEICKLGRAVAQGGGGRMTAVSVKTRIGYNLNIAEKWVAELISAGPDCICMHGRTLKQGYHGEADWDALRGAAKICRESGVLFLGNGDVASISDALEKIELYGVDGVLVGRALMGNPWFFGGKEPNVKMRLKAAKEHAKYFAKLGDRPFHNIRKHLAWYIKGFEGAKELRMELMKVENYEDVEKILF